MKEYKCEICEKDFGTKDTLRKHFDYTHDNDNKAYNCNVCTKTLQTQKSLVLHIKTIHLNQLSYQC